MNPAVSDLIVPVDSQRNGQLFGEEFEFHVHAAVNGAGFQAEGSSVDMREKIAQLLTSDPTMADFTALGP